jgi:uncharacterized protein YcfJ
MQQAMIIAGFALLAILAVAGWTRTPDSASMAPNNFAVQATGTPIGYDVNGRPVYAPAQQQDCVEPLAVQSAAYAPAEYAAPRYRTSSRPRVVRQVVETERAPVVVRKNRSTKKSVAIVAGSAGAGAAIGALAGGGKGAAIGALTGGAGGFIYDRLTHNR